MTIQKVIGFLLCKRRKKPTVEIRCPKCLSPSELSFIIPVSGPGYYHELQGRLRCEADSFEWPIKIRSGRNQPHLLDLRQEMPDSRSQDLSVNVPQGIAEDVREAERAHAAACERASAAMCRRALQLGLMDKGISDGGLEGMIRKAGLKSDTSNLALSIKGLGDIAVHRKDALGSGDIALLIHATVQILNELFSPPRKAGDSPNS